MGFNCYSIIFPLIMWKREPGLRFSLRKQPVDLHEPPVAAHFDVSSSGILYDILLARTSVQFTYSPASMIVDNPLE